MANSLPDDWFMTMIRSFETGASSNQKGAGPTTKLGDMSFSSRNEPIKQYVYPPHSESLNVSNFFPLEKNLWNE